MILSHIDDIGIAGIAEFLNSITMKIKEILNVSKIGKGRFWITGIDMQKNGDKIIISLEDYCTIIFTQMSKLGTKFNNKVHHMVFQ